MAIFMGDTLHPMFFTLNHHLVWTQVVPLFRLEG